MEAWYDKAIELKPKYRSGLRLRNVYPPKLVLHTVESYNYSPNPENYYGHQFWPNFTGPTLGGDFYQHFSITVGGYALKNKPGGVDTNTENVTQIEIPGKAAEIQLMLVRRLEYLGDFISWWFKQVGLSSTSLSNWAQFVAYPDSYGYTAAQRLNNHAFLSRAGVIGHQHVPENDHGDPGKINTTFLYNHVNKMEQEMKPADWVKFVQAADADGNLIPGPVYAVNLLTEEIDGVEPGEHSPHAVRENFYTVFGVSKVIHPVDPMFIKQFEKV